MKEVVIKITFDDTDGYKGHGDDAGEVIKGIIEKEMEIELEADGVVKPGWEVEIINNTNFQSWLQKRLKEELKNKEEALDVGEKASRGGKIRMINDTIEYLKTHPLT